MTINDLTHRERDVIMLVACGLRNKQIARQLVIEEGTVKTHMSRILKKLGARNRLEACMILFKQMRQENGG